MSDDFARVDAVGQAELVRRGDAHPSELVEAAIGRIEALDGEVNAVIHRSFDSAREAARGDLPDGPFRGVPFLLKDLWPASAGDPFHLGNRALAAAGYRHPTDTNLVTAYRRAGFVLLGRTNTPELGLVATTEPLAYGPSRNPWDLTRGTGGSSGGAAAAVSAGMVPAANASDGGGSIRIPAALCGLVGLKPSRGRVSMGPMQDEWGLSVQHVVSHSVRDTAAILDATAMPFPGDGVVAPAPARPWSADAAADPGLLRIGVLPASPTVETADECSSAATRLAARLSDLGHDVTEAHPPGLARLPELASAFSVVWAVNAARSVDTIGRMLGRSTVRDDVEPGTWMLAELGRSFDAVALADAHAAHADIRRAICSWWSEGWDLLLTPTTALPAPRLGELVAVDEDPSRPMIGSIPFATFTSIFNVTGQPAISVPAGRTAEGLPLGCQFIADYGREDLLIGVAGQLQRQLDWSAERSPLHP